MKQVVQSVKDGELRVVDVPLPTHGPAEVLVACRRSLLSAGTERAVRRLASSSLLEKARARPDLVRQVIARAQTEGVRSTMQAVRSRLDEDMPLGYSAAGVVVSAGEAVLGLRVGDRVATASAGHAEYQVVPGLLAVHIPEDVGDRAAAFSAVAAIALQGLRQAEVEVGGTVVVIGLGLVGQLTLRLAIAAGLRAIGIDINRERAELAAQPGAVGLVESGADTTASVLDLTRGRGADAVLVTAATSSSEPVTRALALVRDRGRIVVVGDVGLELDRTPFYEKEAELRFARSYGPGRYERTYEEYGIDYPIGQVRWTEARNMEAFLDLVSSGRVKVDDLVTHVFSIDEAHRAYDVIEHDPAGLAVQLSYDAAEVPATAMLRVPPGRPAADLGVGLLGAGTYARATLAPALSAAGWTNLVAIASARGLSARHFAERHNVGLVLSTSAEVITLPEVDVVFVLTPHESHARIACEALLAGKHVFVEKPLALDEEDLAVLIDAYSNSDAVLWSGFNRRYSEPIRVARQALGSSAGPIVAQYRVNAGRLPPSHWYHDRRQGGRLLGEVCHFVDTVSWLIGEPPQRVSTIGTRRGETLLQEDVILSLSFADGSVATVAYASGGHPSMPKERLEVLGRGHSIVVDDYRNLLIDGKRVKLQHPGKGHVESLTAFRRALLNGDRALTETSASLMTTSTMLAAARSLSQGGPQVVDVIRLAEEGRSDHRLEQ